MSLKILDDKIKSKDVSGVYLFYGDEEFDKERYEEKIKKCFDNLEVGVNLYILDKTNIDMLADLCDLVSFLGSKKLIIVKETKDLYRIGHISFYSFIYEVSAK